ncbi:MAG: hypothetical protein U5K43_01995 [Halofilum sp. (in: g-proteobacteria)]|nr:hypothetical protein [Halofilum sp. (in: g-proteobacteria)]
MSVFGGGGEGAGGEGGEGGGEGGEGGEAGSYGPSATESPGVYYTQLALMLGHMEVGRALYEAGQPAIGSTHLGHPAAEHLPAVRAALAERGMDETCARIEQLAREATGNADWSAVQSTFEATQEAIRAAMDDVPAGQRRDPSFVSKVLTAMLHQARHEYQEAIDDGEFVADHEYHDSWGFVQVGRRLLDDNADAFRAADADAYAELREHYERVMAAWPTATVPSRPALSVPALYGRISAFEFAAGKFH